MKNGNRYLQPVPLLGQGGQQQQLRIVKMPFPTAMPISLPSPLNTPEGPVLPVWGGLTPLEYMAGQCVAAAVTGKPSDDLAGECVSLAQAILDECARRQLATVAPTEGQQS